MPRWCPGGGRVGRPRYASNSVPNRLTGVGRSASRSGWPGVRAAMKLLARISMSDQGLTVENPPDGP